MKNKFTDYNLRQFLNEALEHIGFIHPKEIQVKVIPEIKYGRDLVVQSQTGSGKTHAFLLPLINNLDLNRQETQILITAPSRELANQLYQAAKELVKFAPTTVHVENYIGGVDKEKQLEKLETIQPHIAIGTPGRLLDMIESNALNIYTAPYMVVDEADMTLDMGFLADVDQIAQRLPEKHQLLVFSATIPKKLEPFFRKYMHNPKFIYSDDNSIIADTIDNWLIATKTKDRVDLIYDVLTIGQPYLALIFANTKDKVDEIAERLSEKGLECAVIHGGLEPRERRRVMRQIRNLEYQFVVATDLAARGIDIDGVSHVVNAEIPDELDFFVHRVGRTGRNNLPGIAITFYTPDELESIQYLEEKGIVFSPKEIRNNQMIDVKHHDQRQRRKEINKKREYDPEIAGMVKKAKKKIKPNYKKKINRYKKRKDRRNRRLNKKNK